MTTRANKTTRRKSVSIDHPAFERYDGIWTFDNTRELDAILGFDGSILVYDGLFSLRQALVWLGDALADGRGVVEGSGTREDPYRIREVTS